MALPETIRRRAEKQLQTYCEQRVPPHVRDKVRLAPTFRSNTATIYEYRAPIGPGQAEATGGQWIRQPVAQFRYDPETQCWQLYFPDRNGRWHVYDEVEPSPDLAPLIEEVEADPTGIFWG